MSKKARRLAKSRRTPLNCGKAASVPRVFECRLLADIVAKVFGVANEKFLEPLMRVTRGDVSDQIVSSKIMNCLPCVWACGNRQAAGCSGRQMACSGFAAL